MAADKIDISKSEFILSQPADLHAVDVVVNARDAGLAIDLPLVYAVRTRASARRQVPSPSAETSPVTTKSPASASSRRAGPRGARHRAAGASKADLNRAETNLTAEQIAEPAKPAESKLEVGSVHNARGPNTAKQKPVAKKTSPRAFAKPKKASPRVFAKPKKASPRVFAKPEPLPPVSIENDEELLMIIAAEVGLGRAIEVLQAERARVKAIFGG
jgi:hypothetical protein